MVKKFCPRCKNYSYSAATAGRWICPKCGNDLTKMPFLAINRHERKGEARECLLTLVRDNTKKYR